MSEINESGLTDKQERFAHEYLIDQNASAACLRAGYSARSRGPQAAHLMGDPAVRARVKDLLEELYERIKLDAERLVRERMRTAFFDPRRLLGEDSRPLPFKQLDAETAGVMLLSYDVRANGEQVMRVRQPSRSAALTALERRFMQFMRMQAEGAIAERENGDLYRALGRDTAEVGAGGVMRLTRGRVEGRQEVEDGESEAEMSSAFPSAGIQPPSQPHCGGACKHLAFGGGQQCCPKPLLTPSKGEGADRRETEVVPAMEERVVTAQVAIAPADAAAQAAAATPVPITSAAVMPAAATSAAAASVAGTAPPAPAKVCVPAARASMKGWSDAWGNIDVDHPHIPPEVKARELEKRRRKQEEEAARNNPGLLLNYMHSTVGQPNPPWPRPSAQFSARNSPQRFAISEDDPFGTGGTDY